MSIQNDNDEQGQTFNKENKKEIEAIKMKNKLLGILVTEEQHKEIALKARAEHKTISKYLSNIIFKEV